MQKGCLIELSDELEQYSCFINSLIKNPKPNQSLVKRVSSELLSSHIEAILDDKLNKIFKAGVNIYDTFLTVVSVFDHDDFSTKDLVDLEEFLSDIGRDLYMRLKDMFHNVDTEFALWNIRSINQTVVLVEYLGDYRIMEWHERSGIAYDAASKDVSYEFEISPATNLIRDLLKQYRGKYAGGFFNKAINHITNTVIDEFVFYGNDLVVIESSIDVKTFEYPMTRSKLKDYFPAISSEQIAAFIVDVEACIIEYVKSPIQLVTHLDDVNSWTMSDNILTIQVDKPLTIVDFGERLKNDIRVSVSNQDWVPPKLRELAGVY